MRIFSEIGYIESMRDEVFLHKDNTMNLVWFIKIPATEQRYFESAAPAIPSRHVLRVTSIRSTAH
jgi:hypothetical protein